jgi:hypothetical protein
LFLSRFLAVACCNVEAYLTISFLADKGSKKKPDLMEGRLH